MLNTHYIHPVANTRWYTPMVYTWNGESYMVNTHGIHPVVNTNGIHPVVNSHSINPVVKTHGIHPVVKTQDLKCSSINYKFFSNGCLPWEFTAWAFIMIECIPWHGCLLWVITTGCISNISDGYPITLIRLSLLLEFSFSILSIQSSFSVLPAKTGRFYLRNQCCITLIWVLKRK